MLEIIKIEVTEFSQNARIIYDTDSLVAVVVDPGGDSEKIFQKLKDHNLKLAEIWLTHSHLDHCGGVKSLLELVDVPVYGSVIEKEMRAHVKEIAYVYGLAHGYENCPEPDGYLEDGDKRFCGKFSFQVIFTPGHSPGHLCFYCESEQILLAGDTIFAGSIGRTDLPGGNYETLMDSIRSRLFLLPDSTRILSGHGPDTDFAHEKKNNPFLIGA